MAKKDTEGAAAEEEEESSSGSDSDSTESGSDEETVATEAGEDNDGPAEPSVSAIDALLSLIPYTKQYKRAQLAFHNLNAIEEMQEEVKRATELLDMLDDGKHDIVLAQLRSDMMESGAGQDFHIFNRFKSEAEQNGEWSWKPPRHLVRKKNLNEKDQARFEHAKHWRRCRHMLTDAYSMSAISGVGKPKNMDVSTSLEMARGGGNAHASRKGNGKFCCWKKEDDSGRVFVCSNKRYQHPTRMVVDVFGVNQPDLLATCVWHVDSCCGDHGDGRQSKVMTPNEYGLCNACYVQKMKRQPKAITVFKVVGAHVQKKETEHPKVQEEVKEELTEATVCKWTPTKGEFRDRGFVCTNKVFRNPESRALCDTCAWHVPGCTHPSHKGKPAKVTIPNQEGLCVAHFVAKFGEPPPKPTHPWPGMVTKLSLVKQDVVHKHWACPSGEPEPLLPPYRPYTKADRSKRVRRLNKMAEARKRLHAALELQKAVRRWFAYRERKRRRLRRVAAFRMTALPPLQALVRGNNTRLQLKLERQARTRAANTICRIFRGFRLRKRLKEERAIAVLQRAALRMYNRLMARAAQVTLKKRQEMIHRQWAVHEIQRVVRGHFGRDIARRRREHMAHRILCAIDIQRVYRGRKDRIIRDEILAAQRDYLAALLKLQRIWRAKIAHAKFFAWIQRQRKAVPQIQRVVRGHFGRVKARDERKYVQLAWMWLNPSFDREHYDRYVAQKKYKLPQPMPRWHRPGGTLGRVKRQDGEEDSQDEEESVAALVAQPFDIMDYVPLFQQADKDLDHTVSREDFAQILKTIFRATRSVATGHDAQTFMRMFDFEGNHRLNYLAFLRYGAKQSGPCQKHRRAVCGDCNDRGMCYRLGCDCGKFNRDESKAKSAMCTCGHDLHLHELVPLKITIKDVLDPQVMDAEQMDLIFNGRSHDHYKPDGIQGLDIEDSGKRPRHLELAHRRAARRQRRRQRLLRARSAALAAAAAAEAAESPDEEPPMEALPSLLPDSFGLIKPRLQKKVVERWHDELDHATMRNMFKEERQQEFVEVVDMTDIEREQARLELASNQQTNVELERGFTITEPVPLIVNNELRITTEVTELYLYLLENLRDPELRLVEDPQAFTEVAFRYNAFLERHWKKLVIDIRTGKLNRHLKVAPALRQQVEQGMLPDNARSKLVNLAFSSLGFLHTEAAQVSSTAGKGSLHNQPKALCKSVKRSGAVVPSTMLSPIGPASRVRTFSAGGDGDSEDGGGGGGLAVQLRTSGSAGGLGTTGLVGTTNSIFGAPCNTLRRAHTPITHLGGAEGAASGGLTIRSYFEQVDRKRQTQEQQTILTTPVSFDINEKALKKGLVRRSSFSDVRAGTPKEVIHRMAHVLRIQPRRDPSQPVQNHRHVRRFVCGHPGCGQVFSTEAIAKKHEKEEHSQRQRLAIANPRSDQYLRTVWPAGMPWLDKQGLAADVSDPASFSCPLCSAPCATKMDLISHLRVQHTEAQLKGALRLEQPSRFEGPYVMVPPFKPPVKAPVPMCPYHDRAMSRCPFCRDVQAFSEHGPVLPLKYYTRIRLELGEGTKATNCNFKIEPSERTAFILDEQTGDTVHVQLIAACEDKHGDKWVAVTKFWDFVNLESLNFDFEGLEAAREGEQFSQKHELIQDNTVTYIPLSRLRGHCFTLSCDVATFKRKKKYDELPKSSPLEHTKFCTLRFDSRTRAIVGPREMDTGLPAGAEYLPGGGGGSVAGSGDEERSQHSKRELRSQTSKQSDHSTLSPSHSRATSGAITL